MTFFLRIVRPLSGGRGATGRAGCRVQVKNRLPAQVKFGGNRWFVSDFTWQGSMFGRVWQFNSPRPRRGRRGGGGDGRESARTRRNRRLGLFTGHLWRPFGIARVSTFVLGSFGSRIYLDFRVEIDFGFLVVTDVEEFPVHHIWIGSAADPYITADVTDIPIAATLPPRSKSSSPPSVSAAPATAGKRSTFPEGPLPWLHRSCRQLLRQCFFDSVTRSAVTSLTLLRFSPYRRLPRSHLDSNTLCKTPDSVLRPWQQRETGTNSAVILPNSLLIDTAVFEYWVFHTWLRTALHTNCFILNGVLYPGALQENHGWSSRFYTDVLVYGGSTRWVGLWPRPITPRTMRQVRVLEKEKPHG